MGILANIETVPARVFPARSPVTAHEEWQYCLVDYLSFDIAGGARDLY